jgi:hypothetical protein
MSPPRRAACLLFASLAALASACTSILGDYHAGAGGAGGAGGDTGSSESTTSGSNGISSAGSLTSATGATSGVTTSGAGTTSAGTTSASSAASSTSASGTSTAAGGGTCTNMMQDGNETDIDCGGGDCNPCGLGRRCGNLDANCKNGNCQNDICTPLMFECGNRQLDPLETDIDCGGPNCPGCGPNQKCQLDSDCFFNLCVNERCALFP